MAIIHKSLSRLYPMYLDGTLALADAEYESRAGQAGIDIIMNVVYGEYCSVTNIPPRSAARRHHCLVRTWTNSQWVPGKSHE